MLPEILTMVQTHDLLEKKNADGGRILHLWGVSPLWSTIYRPSPRRCTLSSGSNPCLTDNRPNSVYWRVQRQKYYQDTTEFIDHKR